MRDLLEGVKFTVKTHHSNLTYLNNAGSKKVLNWKTEIENRKLESGKRKTEIQSMISDSNTLKVPRISLQLPSAD